MHTFHWHDLPVALIEDLVCIGGSILVVSRAVFLRTNRDACAVKTNLKNPGRLCLEKL